jgi:hypothetical protein
LVDAPKRLMGEGREESRLVKQGTAHPLIFVSVASKRLSASINPLFATHTKVPVSVASKEVSEMLQRDGRRS